VRLVTLTGPPGAGKTRLALRAAELSTAEGVYFVGLAPIVDSALVVPSIAQALGIDEASGQSLTAFLADKQYVLLLDNVEQVIDAAPSVAELLAGAPRVKILATSRERLRIAAERVYPVAPMAVDESVELFVLRAQAINPSFVLDEPAAVAAICERLDGLPLAIELAAARTTLLDPAEILRRLDQRLSLLTSRSRDVPTRQQTLRDTLEWSYQLLAEEEQASFSRLGVFRGGFDLRAAEAVCDVDLDVAASLVDKNLIRRHGDRFSMLETMREYALERLAANTDLDELRDRHAAYFLDLAERAYGGRVDSDEEWAVRLERDHDNCRAAHEWLAESNPDRARQLTSVLGWFWHAHSHMSEGRRRLEQALAGATARDATHARSLTALGTIAGWQGDIAAARPLLEDAIGLWQQLGDTEEEALTLEALAWSYFWVGENEAGREVGERALLLQKELGNERLVNRARLTVCQIVVAIGDVDTATALATESLAVATAQEDAWSLHLAHHFLADCAVIARDYPTAHDRYQRSLRAAMAIGNRTETSLEIQGVAMALAGLGQPERAIRLDTAASAELARQGVDISGVEFWAKLRFDARTTAESQLDPLSVTAADEAGAALSLEDAMADALGA
jgi:predicted ATPase